MKMLFEYLELLFIVVVCTFMMLFVTFVVFLMLFGFLFKT